MDTDLNLYLRPTAVIASDHPRIQALAASLSDTDRSLTAARLFTHAREAVAYDMQSPFAKPEDYHPVTVLERGRGYCVQKSVLLCALARAAGIPARLIFADIQNHRAAQRMRSILPEAVFVYHCYVGLHLDRWLQVTPSFERALCEAHGYPLCEFDGRSDAIFAPVDSEGRPFVTYLCHHGVFADLPLTEILSAWEQAYGRDRVLAWRRALES